MDSLEQAREALKPCPFCGSSDDELMTFCDPDEGRDNSGPSRRIQCAVCHVEAPFYPTEAEAVAAWNRRAALSRPVEGVKGEPENVFNGFMTCVSGDGDPYVKVQFKDLAEAQSFHSALRASISSMMSVSALAAPPVAESEALRERVADAERERDEAVSEFIRQNKYLDDLRDDHDHWRGRANVAEARLAQAERGPAVTKQWDIEATAEHIARELSSIPGGRYHEPTYNAAKAGAKEALKRAEATVAEAALHPQSAAGEEGKP